MSKGQATSLVSVVVGGVLALIIGAILVYSVGFAVIGNLNTSTYNTSGCALYANCTIPYSQQSNMATFFLLMGVMVIIIALVVFLSITRLVG